MGKKLKGMFKKEQQMLENDGKLGAEYYHVQQKAAEQQKRKVIIYCENLRQYSR
ncbi:hypothetical protein [Lentibacillus saliphilus]|uniref:hypothetical protein n=1 Tax=Lentibacillus saliphilus TaxID=2737028 RepID=UPI001C2F4A08|nr:hypothetical protein [Lentibacillus saliphilus]